MRISLPFRMIHEKIYELGSALFFDTGSSLLKMPVSIIKVRSIDEIGQIWFIVPAPRQHIHSFEKEFRSQLNFFKKNAGFHLNITGKAFIVHDPEEINNVFFIAANEKIDLRENKSILIKVKIETADYFEHYHSAKNNSNKKFADDLITYLFPDTRFHYPSLNDSLRVASVMVNFKKLFKAIRHMLPVHSDLQ